MAEDVVKCWAFMNSILCFYMKMSPVLQMYFSQSLNMDIDRFGEDTNHESISDVATTLEVGRSSRVFIQDKKLNCIHILNISR